MKIKNIFEPIAKPFKLVDKEILRWYTKRAKKLEEKGDITPKIKALQSLHYNLKIGNSLFLGFSKDLTKWVFYEGFSLSPSAADKTLDINNGKEIDSSGNLIYTDPIVPHLRKVTNLSRLPALAWGLVNTGKGVSDVYNHFVNGQIINANETLFNFSTGIEHLALASSIYFKARDPALLDKAPVWKNLYEKAKEKIKNLVPKPAPEPALIKVNYSLEEKLA